jgi:hypothetical protein
VFRDLSSKPEDGRGPYRRAVGDPRALDPRSSSPGGRQRAALAGPQGRARRHLVCLFTPGGRVADRPDVVSPEASTPFSMPPPVPTSGTITRDQLLPSQCSAPVRTSPTASETLPTTQMSLRAMVAIAEGLVRCAPLATVLQDGPASRSFWPEELASTGRGLAINVIRTSNPTATSAPAIAASAPAYLVVIVQPFPTHSGTDARRPRMLAAQLSPSMPPPMRYPSYSNPSG